MFSYHAGDKGPAYIYTTEKAHTGNVASLVSATGTISATNEVLIGSQVSVVKNFHQKLYKAL